MVSGWHQGRRPAAGTRAEWGEKVHAAQGRRAGGNLYFDGISRAEVGEVKDAALHGGRLGAAGAKQAFPLSSIDEIDVAGEIEQANSIEIDGRAGPANKSR